MGINPFAALSAVERAKYRTAIVGHVVDTMYPAWQNGRTLYLDDIVAEVQAAFPAVSDAGFVEVHRAIAQMEWAGLIVQTESEGRWALAQAPRSLVEGTDFCGQPGCLRPDGHLFDHLPDLHAIHLTTELVVRDEDFVAAWAPGSPWVRIYPDARTWVSGGDIRDVVAAPHATPYTHDALAALVTSWLGHDHHPRWPEQHTQLATETGTLQHRSPRYFAVWTHREPTIEIHASAADWDSGHDPIAVIDVPHDAPFTGLVLAQAAEDWSDRTPQ